MRKTCPIAHTDRFMGVYLPTRYEDVRAVAYDTEHFSSRRVVVRETPPPRVPAPPITSDPPEHRPARMVLLPPFTPDAMKKIEPRARAIANELIDKFIARGSCDAAVEYAQEIPVRVIAHMLGLPEGDGDLYRKWIHQILEVGITDQSALMQAVGEMTHYFMGHVHERSEKPQDDLISYLLQRQVQRPADGRGIRRRRAAAAADRRHRHHLERHRLVPLASGQDARRPPAAGRGARADADGHRGVPARLRARDDGARGGEGDRDQRLHRSSRGKW